MSPQDIQTIHTLLTTRVACQNAREGVAIANLAARLVAHFADAKSASNVAEKSASDTKGAHVGT